VMESQNSSSVISLTGVGVGDWEDDACVEPEGLVLFPPAPDEDDALVVGLSWAEEPQPAVARASPTAAMMIQRC